MLGFLGCFAYLLVASVVNANGRVFVVELGNASSSSSFSDAERACASRRARLASTSELRHAVMECFFSSCTRGWLYGGSLGTTVCSYVGGSLKAVDVRTENATGDSSSSSGFCIKDKGVACGDPPSFPNARLQGQGGFELGDELLYTCVPGYVMPNGHSAFSLLCDSCGEWYGLVQICIKDSTETHVDYDDQFTYADADNQNEDDRPVEVHEITIHTEEPRDQELQEIHFQREEVDSNLDGQHEMEVDAAETSDKERGVVDTAEDPSWGQEVVTTASTDPPGSILTQKHLFWFPSETFQQEQHPVSVDPVTTTQRTSSSQSEENLNSEQESLTPHVSQVEQIPVEQEELDHQDRYEDHDHYDMGEHEEVHYGSRNDSSEERGVHEDSSHLQENVSEEHPDRDDHEEPYDENEHNGDHDEHYDHERDDDEDIVHQYDHDDQDHEERDDDDGNDHYDHNEHESDDYNLDNDEGRRDGNDSHAEHDSHSEHDSREDDDDHHQHVIFVETGRNGTRDHVGAATTTDETWLDGHPVAAHPNEVEELIPGTSVSETPESLETAAPDNPASSSDTLEDDTQQVVPTHSWLLDLTQQPFLDPAQGGDTSAGAAGERANLPGEAGERGEVEGEMGETVCVGDNCPPPRASRRGPTVAAIIAAVCVVAAAVILTVWCYRRRQQKSSAYNMNGKGQSTQHMEMQQKV
ncbi:sushi domain-containing protein 5 [Syngnathus scovelli]|uniref:sushi domain-containing protein 5 n=1 Tax=Syngnathus scovelli TaxID=161590 RepID=UPI0021105EFD|nr:probable serine/threonine-protein kinase kinX [Syngnathus scovelli]